MKAPNLTIEFNVGSKKSIGIHSSCIEMDNYFIHLLGVYGYHHNLQYYVGSVREINEFHFWNYMHSIL